MALKATIFKAELSVADMDRGHYGSYSLTLARHPSETDERLMIRLLAFALHASDTLEFTKGLCVDDEPALWERDLTGLIGRWIELGLPDERRLRRAAGRAGSVLVYSYGGNPADIWWEKNRVGLARIGNLSVINLPLEQTRALAELAARSMQIQCTVQDGQIWLSAGEETVTITPEPRRKR